MRIITLFTAAALSCAPLFPATATCVAKSEDIKVSAATPQDLPEVLKVMLPLTCAVESRSTQPIRGLDVDMPVQNTRVPRPGKGKQPPFDGVVDKRQFLSYRTRPILPPYGGTVERLIITPDPRINAALRGGAVIDVYQMREGSPTSDGLAALNIGKPPLIEIRSAVPEDWGNLDKIMEEAAAARRVRPYASTCPVSGACPNVIGGISCVSTNSGSSCSDSFAGSQGHANGAVSEDIVASFCWVPLSHCGTTWQEQAFDWYVANCAPCNWDLLANGTYKTGNINSAGNVESRTADNGQIYQDGCRSGYFAAGAASQDGFGNVVNVFEQEFNCTQGRAG